MKAEALEQIRARIRYQKSLEKNHSHSQEHEAEEMWKWIRITFYVGFPVCVIGLIKDQLFFSDHGHHHEGPSPDYLAINNKAFPWECETCPLFDAKCWAKCRAERAAGK
jgi:cytochrome c oxidase subunit 6a